MNNMKLKIGFITSIIFYVTFHCLYLFRYDMNWWNDDVLLYLVPIWSIGLFYVGYALSNKFIKIKSIYFPTQKPQNYNIEESKIKWKKEKMFMKYRTAQIGKLLFGAAIPLTFILHYDDILFSVRNIVEIIILFLLTLVCWGIEYKLKKLFR